MKKIIAALSLAIAAAFFAAGCSGTVINLSMKSYWLDSPANDQVGPIDETYTYAVSHVRNNEGNRNDILSVEYAEGAQYIMRLTNVKKAAEGGDPTLAGLDYVPEGDYYKLTADLVNVSGTYRYTPAKGDKKDVAIENDSVRSTIYFKGTINSLMPVWSEKKVVSTSPVLRSGISASPVSYDFLKLEYTVTSKYADNATVTVSTSSEDQAVKDRLSSVLGDHVYKKYKKNAVYFDSDQILFACRALTLSDKYSGSFKTIDVSSDLGSPVTVSLATAQKNAKVEQTGLSVDYKGTEKTSYSTYALTVSASKGGASKTAYYAMPEDKCLLVKYSAPISDRLGTLVYTLTSVA